MNEQSLYLIVALIFLAFTGSWHCAVMCGPIALGLSKKGDIREYHLGRALSYVTLGALAGAFGHTLFKLEGTFAKILAAGLLSLFFVAPLIPAWRFDRWGHLFFARISKQRPGLFIFGCATVLLPCGWLWTFLAAAAASASPWAGALITGILWVSSVPALSAITHYFQKNLKDLAAPRVRLIQQLLSFAGIYAVWSHFFL